MHTLEVLESLERSNSMAFGTPAASLFAEDHRTTSILHDLRSPLCAIRVCAEILRSPDLGAEQRRRLVTNIDRAACEMRDLLAEFAQIARDQAEPTANCNLHGMLSGCCKAVGIEDRDHIEILLDVPARIEIRAARKRMQRVFVNLFRNAVEAMPGGVTIRVTATEAAGHVLIAIEDNGPGIPAEILDRLFEPLVSAGKKDGMGLGLALSRQTVRDHGGDLWVEPAAGARFVLSLPLHTQLS